MIEELRVRNLALIDEAVMGFSKGLTVLTGETGAGKTALLNAIKLAIGARGDSTIVRDGSDETTVEAVFEVDDPTIESMRERGFELDSDQVLVKRVLPRNGHSKCYVNDGMVTVRGLSDTIGPLVELHGQHEHQALLSPQNHIGYIDKWGADTISEPLKVYREALEEYRHCKSELDDAVESAKTSDFKLQQARFLLSQIDPVNPGETERDDLEARVPILRNGEQLAEAASESLEMIRGEGKTLDSLSGALSYLEHVSGTDKRLDDIEERIEGSVADLEDIANELREYRDSVEFDPEALQETLDRLGELDGLVRKFGPTYETMLEQWREAGELVEMSEEGPERIERLQRESDAARSSLESAALDLAKARTEAASKLCPLISEDVSELAMQGAVFELREEKLEFESWNSNGSRRYELMYAPAENISPRPLSKIASGGELSRIMLSLECLLGQSNSCTTLVFDEVDAGIGGITAQAVAARLSKLAERQQVIVVTHLAQVAAVADNHLLVEKSSNGAGASTRISKIEGEDRVAEIARMLSGTSDEVALQHARNLLGSRS
ncbi:MAG: DNA repair protein RecN [Coriobacteriales bacterium]|jgi:DNA repair protein RecN (Recombination protein N)